MANNVTLKDVARRAGVSYQTVSKILRNQIQVTPEVRARVQQAVEELGYRPNITARSLRLQTSHLIGYSWKSAHERYINPILEEFEQSIVNAAERLGYHILLFPYHQGPDLYRTYEELVHSGRVDGFILSDLEFDDPRIPVLTRLQVPLMAFGRAHSNGSAFPYVDVDGRAGIRQAVEHLLEQGHQRIAFLGWPEQSRVGTDRLSGYLEAMEKAGLSADPAWVMRSAGQYDFGYAAAHTLLDLPAQRRPSAIVTVYDLIAVGAVQAVQEHGLQVGCDVAVTGFDDTPLLPYLLPSLTTLRQPVWEIGQRVVELLVRLFAGEKPGESESHVLLPPELVIRDSSRGYRPR